MHNFESTSIIKMFVTGISIKVHVHCNHVRRSKLSVPPVPRQPDPWMAFTLSRHNELYISFIEGIRLAREDAFVYYVKYS